MSEVWTLNLNKKRGSRKGHQVLPSRSLINTQAVAVDNLHLTRIRPNALQNASREQPAPSLRAGIRKDSCRNQRLCRPATRTKGKTAEEWALCCGLTLSPAGNVLKSVRTAGGRGSITLIRFRHSLIVLSCSQKKQMVLVASAKVLANTWYFISGAHRMMDRHEKMRLWKVGKFKIVFGTFKQSNQVKVRFHKRKSRQNRCFRTREADPAQGPFPETLSGSV